MKGRGLHPALTGRAGRASKRQGRRSEVKTGARECAPPRAAARLYTDYSRERRSRRSAGRNPSRGISRSIPASDLPTRLVRWPRSGASSSAAAPPTIARYTPPQRAIAVDAALQQAAFADDRADAVLFEQTGREPVHARAGGGADRQLFISSIRRVCGRRAPCADRPRRVRSAGGAMPSSKMRICVASRMPNIAPSSKTVSSSFNCRTSASLSGVVRLYCILDLSRRRKSTLRRARRASTEYSRPPDSG